MKLRYTKTALRQIELALSYIGDRSPQGATRVAQRIEAVLAVARSIIRTPDRRPIAKASAAWR